MDATTTNAEYEMEIEKQQDRPVGVMLLNGQLKSAEEKKGGILGVKMNSTTRNRKMDK